MHLRDERHTFNERIKKPTSILILATRVICVGSKNGVVDRRAVNIYVYK